MRPNEETAGATVRASMAVVTLCARQELVLAARSRWLQTFAVVFALLAIAVAGAGYILAGGSGVHSTTRNAVANTPAVVDIDKIKPGMGKDELERIRQEVARFAAQSLRGA